jgi:3-keto-5-aminohexanoate cleavage enzyme
MQPLIITATPNICWLKPDVPYPETVEEIREEAKLCRENGASIFHIHAEDRWAEVIHAIRSATDIIIQCGMSSLTLRERMDVFMQHSDMLSIILNHHDEAFEEVDCNVLHTKDELIEYANTCDQYGVKPEFEVWHAGSIWNLNFLIKKGLISKPYITTLFFGWPGGTWSPPTVEEYLYRRRLLPEGCVVTVSIMHEDQIKILTAAIVHGDNVRVGTEDYPYNRKGEISNTYELVEEIAKIAQMLGRPLATPQYVKNMLSIQ